MGWAAVRIHLPRSLFVGCWRVVANMGVDGWETALDSSTASWSTEQAITNDSRIPP